MVNFTQGYFPPGVYVEEDVTPLAAAPAAGLPVQHVVLIGLAAGYQTRTTQVTLDTSEAVLPDQGINLDTLRITSVSTSEVVDPESYAATKSTTEDPTDRDYTTTISSATDLGPVWVSYQFTSPDYYTPVLMETLEDVTARYGQPNVSPLSMAAHLAFANGADQVVLAPIDAAATTAGQVRSGIQAVYSRINTAYEDAVIVPIPSFVTAQADMQAVAGDLSAHLNSASSAGYFRVGLVGFEPSNVDPLSLGVSNRRLLLAYAGPGGMQVYDSVSGTTSSVGHQYLAAALAGRLISLPVEKSLTRERILGFSGLAGQPLPANLKNSYSAGGVTLVEADRNGRLIVRHAVSTDPSNIFSAELSLTRARDVLVAVVQAFLDQSGLIGSAINEDTPISVKTIASGALELCKDQRLIVDYTNLQVRQASLNPSVVEVRFAYRPSFPLNYITVTFSVDLTMATDAAITDVTGENFIG